MEGNRESMQGEIKRHQPNQRKPRKQTKKGMMTTNGQEMEVECHDICSGGSLELTEKD